MIAPNGRAARTRPPKILYLVEDDWSFLLRLLPVARGARDAGSDVIVATAVNHYPETFAEEGLRLARVVLPRRRRDVLRAAGALLRLLLLYHREKPDLVHHEGLWPVLYGGLAAVLIGMPVVLAAPSGLPRLVASERRGRAGMLLRRSLRWLFSRSGVAVLVQNEEDAALLDKAGYLAERSRVFVQPICGVDLDYFRPMPDPPGLPVAALVGRMLWDKGVAELVTAARLLRERAVPLRIVLVGPLDPDDPAAIAESTLYGWQRAGLIEWRGPLSDIAGLWSRTHIAVLPSPREELPLALLEAAACGRPLLATDVPGCREIVQPWETGLLVPPRDAEALAEALALLMDRGLRQRLGTGARALVEAAYGEELVVDEMLDLYLDLLSRPSPAALEEDETAEPELSETEEA